MDKSLDEIIKSRFNGKKQQKNPGQGLRKGILKKPKQGAIQKAKTRQFQAKPQQKQQPQQGAAVHDARSRIIVAKRAKISDARVILAKKARHAPRNNPPSQQHGRKFGMVGGGSAPQHRKPGNGMGKRIAARMPVARDEDDDDELMDMDHAPVLRRTVKNDIRPPPAMPPLPTFSRDRSMSDPFDCYEPYERPAFIPKAPPAPIIVLDDPYYDKSPRKGILRKTSPQPASQALKSRLYASPDPRQPSGIFGRDRDPDKDSGRGGGVRIVVSNLHSSVTQSDIQELFEDVGQLVEAILVRPGVAEVTYARLHDAEVAVETYHNRQLDGQPMKCLLVRPRSNNVGLQGPGSRAKNVEVDLDTLHKVLFSR